MIDGAGLALPAEDADAAGAKCEVLAAGGCEADPTRGEDAQNVRVREEGDFSGRGRRRRGLAR